MKNKFTIQEVRAFWDSVAPIYEPMNKKVGYVHIQRYEQALADGDLHPGQKILNIWSRTGNLVPYLRRIPGLDIVNREASPRMMAIAQAKLPSEHFALTDLADLSEFKDNTFDRIFSLETYEHTPDPSQLMQEFARILKPGGRLIMSMPPKGHEVLYRLYLLFAEDHGEGPHVFPWPFQVKRALRDAGLIVAKHKRYIMLPFGNERVERAMARLLTGLFGWNWLGNFGVRHFFTATK